MKKILSLSAKEWKWFFLCLVAAALFANCVGYLFVHNEHTIYYNDLLDHWKRYKELSEMLRENFGRGLYSIWYSIMNLEYNQIVVLPLLPFYDIVGVSRMAFILLSTNVLLLPTICSFVFLQLCLDRRNAGETNENGAVQSGHFAVIAVPFVMALFFPRLWQPVIRGIESIWAIGIANLVFAVYILLPLERQKIQHLFASGCVFAFLILTRRWYSIWTVAFMCALAIEQLSLYASRKQQLKQTAKALLLKLPLTAMFAGIALLIVAAPIFMKYLTTSYGDIYSGYQISNPTLSRKISIELLDYYGIWIFILAAFGCVAMLLQARLRRHAVLMLAQWMLTYGILSSLQQPSTAHHIMLFPVPLVFASYFVIRLFMPSPRLLERVGTAFGAMRRISISAGLLCLAICGLCLFVFLVPGAAPYKKYLWKAPPKATYYPLQRTDIPELIRLEKELSDLVKNTDDKIYILGNSAAINVDILRFFKFSVPEARDLSEFFLNPSIVDKVDGLRPNFFLAKYVIITDPIQFHLRPEDQKVIGLPSEYIVNKIGIGTSYEKLPHEFHIGKDIAVFVYKRIKLFKQHDIDTLLNTLKQSYPDKTSLFEPAIPEKLISPQ